MIRDNSLTQSLVLDLSQHKIEIHKIPTVPETTAMSSNGSNVNVSITEATPSDVLQATAKCKEWYVPSVQVGRVAIVLWNVAAGGFVLNTALLVRYLRSKWRLFPLPSPPILVNLCLSNILLVLGVFLAAVSLSFDIGESSVKAGEVELFFTVGVLIQSWLGQVMVLICGGWARKQQNQTKIPCTEDLPAVITNKVGKLGMSKAVSYRSVSRQGLYQPCPRHSRLTQTFKDRQSFTDVSVNRSREALRAASNLSIIIKQRQTVRWWLTWSWPMSLLAATALLMTTANSQDACLTLIPFQRTYMIPGDDISMITVSENSVMRISFMLVLVPVYMVGLGGAVWSALTSRPNKPQHETAESRRVADGIFTKTFCRLRLLQRMKRHRHTAEKQEEQFELRGSQSACNINMNAERCLPYTSPTEKTLESKRRDKPNSCEDERHEIYPEKNKLTQEDEENATSPQVFSASSSHQQHGQRELSYSTVETISLGSYGNNLGVVPGEEESEGLPALDDSNDMTKSGRKANDTQDFVSTGKRTQKVHTDKTFDLTLFETDEYAIHFSNAELNCLAAVKNNDTTFCLDVSRLQAPNPQRTSKTYKTSHKTFYKTRTAQKDKDRADINSSGNNKGMMKGGGKKKSLTLNASTQSTHTAQGKNKTSRDQSRNADRPLQKSSMPGNPTVNKAVINHNNSANDQSPPMTSGPQDRMTSGQAESRLAVDVGRPKELDTKSLSSNGDYSNIDSSSDHGKKLGTAMSKASHPLHLTPLHPDPLPLHLSQTEIQSGRRPLQSRSPCQAVSRPVQCEDSGQHRRVTPHSGLRPAINIVSSSMHHFTIQGRPPSTGHFELYPPGWLNQERFHLFPKVRSRQQQQRSTSVTGRRSHGGARSRLSARGIHQYDSRQGSRMECREDEGRCQLCTPTSSDQVHILQSATTQRNVSGHVQTGEGVRSGSSTHAENDVEFLQCHSGSGSRQGQQETTSWQSSHEVSRPDDDTMGASMSEHSRQGSLPGHLLWSAQCQYQDPFLSRQMTWWPQSVQGWIPHHLSSTKDGYEWLATNPAESKWSAERGRRRLPSAMEYSTAFACGDTNVKESEPKRDYDKEWPCSCGGHLSYKVKCLTGLVMHMFLCLPFALTLVPGVFHESDCGTRLQTLLVVRMLMFCHVLICPLWMLFCFPRHVFPSNRQCCSVSTHCCHI